MMPIINRSYYDAAEKGRTDRATAAHNALAQQQGERVNALMQDPNATPEAYARAGRSDVANSLTNLDSTKQNAAQEGHKRLFIAAQYALNSPDPKAFISQNFPELAKANPTFETDTPEQIGASLQQLLGVHGANAGIGPAVPKERPLINTVGPDGKPIRGEDRPGAPVYVTPEKAPPSFRAMTPQEIKSYGLPDGTAAQINDSTRQIQVINKPDSAQGGRNFKSIQALRKEFDNLPEVKNYKLVLPLYQRAATAPPTRAGDLSIIYALGKMFDPGSVVREGELIMAQNTAPWLTNLVSKANSQLTGEGALSADTRTAIIQSLKGQMESLEQPYNQERERFAGYADENGWEPSSVVGKAAPKDAFAPPAVPTTPAQGQRLTPEQASQLPPGTAFIGMDGQPRVRN